MSLPEEAGKLPWSEGSLILMQNLQHEMEKWSAQRDEGYSKCNKPDCHFCRLTTPVPKPIIPEFIMSSMDQFYLSNNLALWSNEEIKILDRYKDACLPTLAELFPGRTKGSISDKRSRYRKSLGLPLLRRGGRTT